MTYTVGNWTIASHEVDTISATKSLSIPDMDYAHDFSVATTTKRDARLTNTSGTALEPVERVKYGKDRATDIYRDLDTLKVNQLPSPIGTRTLVETIEVLSASNSTTGAELVFPIRIWTCLESSTHNVVTGQALLWALQRHVSQMFATGQTDASMLIRLFRGDLDPTR